MPGTKIAPSSSATRVLAASKADAARGRSRHKAGQYLVAADAPATVRAYTADWKHFSLWCTGRGLAPMPANPQLVGDYLSDLGEGYARATLRRKVAAIARANRHAGHRLDTGDPDGAPYHRAKTVWAVAAGLDITLVPLPGYSPDLMRAEPLWRWLREDVTYHHCHATAEDLIRRVAAFEARINQNPCGVADRLWVKDHLNPEEEKLRSSN